MRSLGLIIALLGGVPALINLIYGGEHAAPQIIGFGALCIVGIIIVVTHPRVKKESK